MPQLIAITVAGAGLIAGLRWLHRKASEHAESIARVEAEARAAAAVPKEMGRLEWDADVQAYRPARH